MKSKLVPVGCFENIVMSKERRVEVNQFHARFHLTCWIWM